MPDSITQARRLNCSMAIPPQVSIAIVVFFTFIPTLSSGQEVQKLPTPADATGWALADLVSLQESDRPFARYIWIPPWGNERWVPAVGFSVNTAANHARTIQPAAVIANGWMMRYDLRRLAPSPLALGKLLDTWDGLAKDDPYFHVPDVNTKLGVAVIAPHLPQEQAAALAGLSLSTGAIYRADWFLVKALSTLDGGRYYEFRQVVRKPEKGSALDNWLSSRGLFVGTTEAVGGERRAAMFRSGVTGKPRRIDIYPTLTGGVGSITRDILDGETGPDAHPIRSLLELRAQGAEVIVQRADGLHDFLLADAKGNILDEAPPDLVRDHTIPAPHTSRLQPAISCIRCHGPEPSEGWQPVTNDVARLLGTRLNVFADISKNLTPEQVADKLAGFYALDVDSADSLLGRGRRDYAVAVNRVTQGIQFQDSKSVVAAVSKQVSDIYAAYQWDIVTSEVAAREIGFAIKQDAKRTNPLDRILSQPALEIPVDPVIGFLRIGVSVNRSDFEIVYADLFSSVRNDLKEQSK